MSYALRNSLILLVVLLLFVGAGWAYIYFVQQPEIEELTQQVEAKTSELREKQQIANQYTTVLEQFENATFFIENFDKTLYTDSNEDRVFDFMNNLNTGNSYTDFTFAFSDSTAQDQYGVMSMNISGEGFYRYLINFIRKMEYSKPLNKISNLDVTPINDLENYGRVSYSFTLNSYYDRATEFGSPTMDIESPTYASLHNPFFPLIREIEPNEENLTDIEQSELIALSSNRAFLLDQTGELQKIGLGESVYLGSLTNINLSEGTATFQLNKGGIIERITLEVNNEEQ